MIEIEYDSRQFDTLKTKPETARAFVQNAMYQAVFSTVLDIRNTAKSPGYVPVKKSDLKRSIASDTVRGDGQVTGYVGSNKDYARIHEFGGRAGIRGSVTITGKLYLTRAVRENQDKIKERFIKLITMRAL